MRSGVNEHAATATPPASDRRRGAPGGGAAAVAARLRSRGPRRRPLPARAPVHDALVARRIGDVPAARMVAAGAGAGWPPLVTGHAGPAVPAPPVRATRRRRRAGYSASVGPGIAIGSRRGRRALSCTLLTAHPGHQA